jgi:hypothetical protein
MATLQQRLIAALNLAKVEADVAATNPRQAFVVDGDVPIAGLVEQSDGFRVWIKPGTGPLESHRFYQHGEGSFEHAASEVVEHVARIRMQGMRRNAAKAVWVPGEFLSYSRRDLLGTNRGGYEKATFKWLLDQFKRMGGVSAHFGKQPMSIDYVWYEVNAWRASDQPRDDALVQVFVADAGGLRDAKRYAKGLVEDGTAIAAEVNGKARFMSSGRGYGTYNIETLGEYRIPELER